MLLWFISIAWNWKNFSTRKVSSLEELSTWKALLGRMFYNPRDCIVKLENAAVVGKSIDGA